ncbi:hypothetical protein PG993_000998 [Apiospora rasikravindrae]|uniref:Uncharacterized protein n=1 Tax=Apiospora rasikravindrae TaxID=990691 RepID=A0ABR1UA49_9PEZI
MKIRSFVFICLANSGNCIDGYWLDLPQESGKICHKPSFADRPRRYTQAAKYWTDKEHAADTIPSENNDVEPIKSCLEAQWAEKPSFYTKRLNEFVRKAAEVAQELENSARQAAAEQIRWTFKSLSPKQQERITRLLTALHDVLEDLARLLEHPGAYLTYMIEYVGIYGEFHKIPEQLLQDIAMWVRQHDKDFQDDTAQVLIDESISTVWFMLKIWVMVSPQTFWGPILSKLGWGRREYKRASTPLMSLFRYISPSPP